MTAIRKTIPIVITVLFGFLTLSGLLVFPALGDLLLSWAAFLAAVALILGILNLLAVHFSRAAEGGGYSVVLVASMVFVFALAATDALALTDGAIDYIFFQVQAPLEAALASLIAFFLLFSGVRLLQHRRDAWSVLFLLSALFFLAAQSPWPGGFGDALARTRDLISAFVVTPGVRGLLLGIALGTITLSLRLIAGLERPHKP